MSIMLGFAIYFMLLMITIPLLLLLLSTGRNELEDELCFYEFVHDCEARTQLNTAHPLSLKALAAAVKVRDYISKV
ncbi:hypothetical protein [Candidatus Albibeggiatoa sp. nov. BB20]|uniref:hypothetical protein n=1 Tax=Candidatus Albibeggiatoa sp. nov. BB20 TaxID=3162723 RepID=UPI0033654954